MAGAAAASWPALLDEPAVAPGVVGNGQPAGEFLAEEAVGDQGLLDPAQAIEGQVPQARLRIESPTSRAPLSTAVATATPHATARFIRP